MNPKEITDFFKKHGNKKTFRIINRPVFLIWVFDGNQVNTKSVIIEEYNGNIKNFIKDNMTDNYGDVYIYEHQIFSDNMEKIDFYKDIPDICIQRLLKLNKIMNNGNI